MWKKHSITLIAIFGALTALLAAQLGTSQPPLPQITIDSVRQAEGDSGTTPFVFTLTRDDATDVSTVDYEVVHDPNSTNPQDLTLTNGTVTFAVGELIQTITVLVNGDTDPEPHEFFYVVLSNPVNATLANTQGTGTILNDDGGYGLLFDPFMLIVQEGGPSQSYNIILRREPSAPITVNIVPDAQCIVNPTSITLDSTNFDRSPAISVTAVDDTVVENTHQCRISHTVTTTDPNYDGLPVQVHTVTVQDNDAPGASARVNIDPQTVVIQEGGITSSVNVSLSTAPTGEVIIGFNPELECFTYPSTIILNASNYQAGEDIRITAVDDTRVEGVHTCSVSLTVSSTDTRYNNAITAPFWAIIIDNDGPWASFTPGPLQPGQYTPMPIVTYPPTFTPMPTSTPTATPVPLIGVVSNEVSRLAMRSGPYLYATLLGGIDAGETYPIIAQNSDEGAGIVWYLVQTEHVTGWVSGRYMTFNQPPNYPYRGSIFDEIDNAPETGVTVTTLTLNDLRRRPSGRTAALGQIPAQSTVALLGRTRQSGMDFWYQVRYEGQTGWIPAYGIVNGNIQDVPIR